MKELILFDELIVKISEDDWDFLCKNRFFSDAPDEEMLQAEFVTGTGITANKKHLWDQASERFSEYIKDLKEISGFQEISFPEHEYESIQNYLNKLGYCYTTRVYKEIGKYKVGELYTAPWGDVLKIDEVKIYWKVSDRPFYDEMSDDEKMEIRKYSEEMGLPYEFIKFSKSTV